MVSYPHLNNMKEITLKCKTCGDVKISGSFTDNNEEAFIVPVALAPTIPALGKYYKTIVGNTYMKDTGNKLKDDFARVTIKDLSHADIFDDETERKMHILTPVECWEQQI